MITALPENICANKYCKRPLHTEYSGNNVGGWLAHRTPKGDYETGYICKQCGNQSTPGTAQIRNYQRLHYANFTVEETKHTKQWQQLVASLTATDEKEDAPSNPKMPTWSKVISRIQKKKRRRIDD